MSVSFTRPECRVTRKLHRWPETAPERYSDPRLQNSHNCRLMVTSEPEARLRSLSSCTCSSCFRWSGSSCFRNCGRRYKGSGWSPCYMMHCKRTRRLPNSACRRAQALARTRVSAGPRPPSRASGPGADACTCNACFETRSSPAWTSAWARAQGDPARARRGTSAAWSAAQARTPAPARKARAASVASAARAAPPHQASVVPPVNEPSLKLYKSYLFIYLFEVAVTYIGEKIQILP